MRETYITLAFKLLYRTLDRRHTALVVSCNALVRNVAVLVLTLAIPQIAVNQYRHRRDLIHVYHFEFSHPQYLLPDSILLRFPPLQADWTAT